MQYGPYVLGICVKLMCLDIRFSRASNKYWMRSLNTTTERMFRFGYLFWTFISNIHYIILVDLAIFANFALSSKFLLIAASNFFMKDVVCPVVCRHNRSMYKYLLRPNSDKFGMPSGHCQVYYAFVTYRWLQPQQNNRMVELMAMLCLGMVICYQRIAEKKHTLGQVLFGSAIGIISGLLVATYWHPLL